jgi:hypothetical protein
MNTPNFAALLDKAPTEIEKPKPLPVGVYTCIVKGLPKFDKSSKKQTEYVEFTLQPIATVGEVDEDALKASGGLEGKTLRDTYYITENSLWRLKKFLEDCGLDVDDESQSLRTLIDATPNCQVNVSIKHEMGNDGQTAYANIAGTSAVE